MALDLQLRIAPRPNDSLMASYACPCGCNPHVAYPKGSEAITDDCCCGNVSDGLDRKSTRLNSSH